MGDTTIVSVIVTTRDRPEGLQRTLDGIFGQSHQALDVVVYDDGSSAQVRDGYDALKRRYDERFRFIMETPAASPGQGPNVARNRAIANAKGELITFCDDDDVWVAADHLAVAADAMARHGDVDLFYADQLAITDRGPLKPTWWTQLDLATLSQYRVEGTELYRLPLSHLLAPGGFAHVNITLARRRLITAIGGFWKFAYYEGDLDFFYRSIDHAGGVLFRPTVVSHHNVPNPALRANVSTRLTDVERLLGRVAICSHARSQVRRAEVMSAIHRAEGYAQRHLAVTYDRQGRRLAALGAAAKALAVKPGFKWSAYLALLGVRASFRRRTDDRS